MAKASTLIDNFNDNTTDATKWNAFGNPAPLSERVREANSRLEILPRSGDSGLFSGYASAAQFDLTNSQIWVELIRPLRTIAGAEVTFQAFIDANNAVYFSVENGNLRCFQIVAGTFMLLFLIPYDPLAHRWLRLREKDASVYWEVSSDGVAWSTVFSKSDPILLTSVTLQMSAGLTQAVPSPGVAVFDNFNVLNTSLSRRVEERRLSARDVREEAAELAAERPHDEHHNNDDEVNYPGRPFIGNFSKSLKHDSLGDPDPISYGSLLRALQSQDPADFEVIQLSTATPSPLKLTNPQCGLAFDVEGPDAQERTQPPAPRFDSEQTAHEAGELYWMAVARDVPFSNYSTDSNTTAAITSLNNEFPAFGGTRPVTAQNLFRGIYPGEQAGPYVSQFLVKGNVDPRKPAGFGRDATDGFISYGAQGIDQRITTAKPGADYLTMFSAWLEAQNGFDKRCTDQFDTVRHFIHTLRDGATFVHFDQVLNAFYNAAWILMSEPAGNQLTAIAATGCPQVRLEFPNNPGNPYDPPGTTSDSKTQAGFATFGPIHLLQVLGEVLGRALREVWWQKWGVHRRLRPEEYGGRVQNHITGARTYPLNASILNSLQTGGLAPFYGNTGERFPNSFLLPQAYPEGAPTHPAYGAGHATASGALTTILKAFFDETMAIKNPLQASADGLSLVAYSGTEPLTVGGELNKMAGNIALFRNAAGVHWRTDYAESLPLGEAVAIGLLQEMSLGFNEDDAYFQFTRFDGVTIRIFDGKVVQVS